MFQYAAGLALSIYHDTELLLDIREYTNADCHNGFELGNVFNISAKLASQTDVFHILGIRSIYIVTKTLRKKKYAWLRGARYIQEPYFHYYDDIKKAPENCYLSGYWQSERYFKDVENVVREQFSFKRALDNKNKQLYEKIRSTNSISVHFRRGDYIKNEKTNRVHGVCNNYYYSRAIKLMNETIKSPVFYVFSDDTDWVRDNVQIEGDFVIVDTNKGDTSYIDMQLMSACNHHIIANSSFSWWGAWLNNKNNKRVMAPRQWFRESDNIIDDLIPADWETL
jgi:hypothetical protein